jgi:tetratricopeptide (TPR) repeat protein/tRNA A-37 threonylcarbamoyl transferase component Bud32
VCGAAGTIRLVADGSSLSALDASANPYTTLAPPPARRRRLDPATPPTVAASDPPVADGAAGPAPSDSPATVAQESGGPSTLLPSARHAAEREAYASVPGYEILGELGRGGMGVVYKARQLRLNRVVALKMILAGSRAGLLQLARFQIEAEAIGRLQHPNIVQIYEIGQHEQCPYFTLEYLEGGCLADRLAGRPQPPHAAAHLLETLARAMHAAHQRGIVHRDLKPGNILLTRDGVPKISDFGLAKRLGEDDSCTHTGAILGTVNYMAPEQAEGKAKDVGPPADIYALGGILYEMLTGRPPFVGDTALSVVEKVRSEEPEMPTRALARSAATGGLRVPRDLETICLKCLRKDPKRRYATAEELAEDLRRFRADEPIQARPVGRLERAAKWVRRKPAAAALVLVSVLAAGGLLGQGLWSYREVRAERDRAEDNFRTARAAVRELLTEVAQEQLAYEPGLELKRKALLEKALEFYKGFLAKKSTDPRVRLETAEAYYLVAEIHRLLGQHRAAQAAFAEAFPLLERLGEEYPQEPEYRQMLANSHNFRGESLRQTGDLRGAEAAYERARVLQERLVQGFPREPAYRQELARTHYNRGIVCQHTNRPRQAKEALGEAAALLLPLVAAAPTVPAYQQHLARCYLNLDPFAGTPAEREELEKRYQEAARLLEGLAQTYPRNAEYRHELGVTYHNLGKLLEGLRRPQDAIAAHRRARDLFGKLATDFPSVPVYRQELAKVHTSLGTALAGDPKAAADEWQRALPLLEALCREFPENFEYRGSRGIVRGNLGWCFLDKQGDPRRARPYLEQGIEDLQAGLKPNPERPAYLLALRNQYLCLARTLLALGEPDAAARAATALPEVYRTNPGDYYRAARFLAQCATQAGQEAASRGYADRALALLREALAHGYKDRESLLKEPDLQPLRQRDDFRDLLGIPAPGGGP